MKRLSPVAAVVGGVACIFRTVMNLLTVPAILRYAEGFAIVNSLIPMILALLLGIALLRQRKDPFLGAVLGIQGGWMLFNAVSAIIRGPALRFILLYGTNMLLGIMFLLLALDCFSERNIPTGSRRKVYGGGMLILGLVYLLVVLLNNTMSTMGIHSLSEISSYDLPNLIVGVFAGMMGLVPISLTYACTGYAVAGPVIRQSVPYAPYYGQANQNPYGNNNQNPYGQNNYNPFGQNNQNPYGQNNQNPFGQNNQPDRDNGKDLNHGSWN